MRLKAVVKDVGFQLVKFIWTNLKVLVDLSEDDIAVACRDVQSLNAVQSSALGIQLDTEKDTLCLFQL